MNKMCGVRVGDKITVRAYKADGTCYRSWQAIIEAIDEELVVDVSPPGSKSEDIKGTKIKQYAVRTFYWMKRPYSLLEVYRPDGQLEELYINIGSPAKMEGSQLSFIDYELDVILKPPHPARILDEEEFAEAIIKYGYSDQLQRTCWEAVREAIHLANTWVPKGIPVFPKQ